MRPSALLAGLVVLAFGAGACDTGSEPASTMPSTIDLPVPRTRSDVSLEQALADRRSVRGFTSERLTLEELSQLLWAAQGVTSEWGGRTAPSAGALYPLEIYVVTPDAVYHYLPEGHRAEILTTDDLRASLADAALGQAAVSEAPAVLVVAAVFARTEVKYGDRAPRYVHLEAGHVAQNVLLQAVAMGLGGVPVGAFSDAAVQRTLSLPEDHEPLYLIPVGHPAAG